MGYMKNLMIEMQEDDEGNAIANAIGITWWDLHGLQYDLEPNINEIGRITSYKLEFFNIPKKIADKIVGLVNNTIILPADIFEDVLDDEDYDYQYGAISESERPFDTFKKEIADLKQLNEIDAGSTSLNNILKRQIYIGLMGSMETYLSDNFIKLTMSDEDFLKRFVETYPEFKKRTFELSDLFNCQNEIANTAKNVMLEIIYHNLVTVKAMYRQTFDIGFPDLAKPLEYVRTRHDLVHRNGKTKDGKIVKLDQASVSEAINDIKNFISNIDDEFTLKDKYAAVTKK